MQWHRSGLIASWEFSEEHIKKRKVSEDPTSNEPEVEKHCERRWGVMVIVKSLQFLPNAINAALKEASHCSSFNSDHGVSSNGSLEPEIHGNMLHVALVGMNNPMSSLQDRYICPLPWSSQFLGTLLLDNKGLIIFQNKKTLPNLFIFIIFDAL